MPPTDQPAPSVRSLFVAWGLLTGRLVRACGAWLSAGPDRAADAIKDTLLDLKVPGEDEPDEGTLPPLPPPAVKALPLLEESLDDLARVFHDATSVINDDRDGFWTAATEERVLELFFDLGRRVLERALEQRVAITEGRLRPQGNLCEEWAKRYRRMQAAEGRWPPREELLEQAEDGPAGG